MGDDSQQNDVAPDNIDDDLASDWESAFQADDFSFSPEDGGDDFFLGDETEFTSATSTSYDFTPPSEKELNDLPDLDEEAFAPQQEEALTDVAATTHKSTAATLPTRLASLYHSAKLRLQLLSRKQQIVAGVAILALLLLPLLIPESGKDNTVTTESTAVDVTAVEDSAPTEIPAEELPPPVEVHEKVRVKWKFPAFLIPAPQRKDTPRKTNFVQTDITLVLLLDEGEKPPADKELMVREIIYQFYSNQPLNTLRRFALARGDMNRALRAWIEKQWPHAPVEAIMFNRYQVI